MGWEFLKFSTHGRFSMDTHDQKNEQNRPISAAQHQENVRTGTESLDQGMGHVGEPTTGEGSDVKQPSSGTTALSGEFRIGDKVTIRVSGSAGTGELELLRAGNPDTIKVSDTELAGLLIDTYFTRRA